LFFYIQFDIFSYEKNTISWGLAQVLTGFSRRCQTRCWLPTGQSTARRTARRFQADAFHRGKGVEEIRVWDESGTYRVIYTARLVEVVYVLHAFQKRTQATSKRDIELASKRYIELIKGA